MTEPRMYGTPQVAEMLGVTAETIRSWIEEGKVQANKINNRWYIPRAEVLRIASDRHG